MGGGAGGDLEALAAGAWARLGEGPKGPAPADDQQIPLLRPADSQIRDFVGDVGDLLGTGLDHVLVVGGIVAHISGNVLFFQAADAVLQSRGARSCPLPDEAVVALVRQETRGAGFLTIARVGTLMAGGRRVAPRGFWAGG